MTNKDCCKDDNSVKEGEKKLVQASQLPISGNPYPSEDNIISDRPGFLEIKIAAARQYCQPLLAPIDAATDKASHIINTGIAHSSSTWNYMSQDNKIKFVGAYGLAAIVSLSRKGLLKKLAFGTITLPLATAVCYPAEAQEKSQMLWYIAKNKLFTNTKTEN